MCLSVAVGHFGSAPMGRRAPSLVIARPPLPQLLLALFEFAESILELMLQRLDLIHRLRPHALRKNLLGTLDLAERLR